MAEEPQVRALTSHVALQYIDALPAALVLEDFPLKRFTSHSFIEALQASLETIFVLAKTQGRVTLAAIDDRRGSARYSLRW